MSKATIARPKKKARTTGKPVAKQIRTFRSAVNFLNSLTNFERAVRVHYNETNFGLTRMKRILNALGNPQTSYKTVHIAGTKGKGSTATMLASMLQGCGLKTGLYTSPHILDIRERIAVDSTLISESEFARAVNAVWTAATKIRVNEPTFFEVLTAAAFVYFEKRGVDIAVVETGLGGRLDATNIIQPEVVGMTSISYDHINQLGRDIVGITREKAGVMKPGAPVISAPQRPEVREALMAAAKDVDAPLRFSNEGVDFSYRFEFSRSAGRHARICLTTPTSRFEHLQVPLFGEHQAVNCSLALCLADVLKSKGLPIDDQKAMAGLAEVNLPGRMQMISETPRVLVDGAHNAASISALMRAIGQHITYDSMIVIFGCHKDKDVSGMMRQIQLGADKIIFTSVGTPRSCDPAELAAEYTEHSGKMAQVTDTLEEAMQIAASAGTREDLICITGSFYLVAQAIRNHSAES